MNPDERPLVTLAPWGALTRFTDARIALGRAGHSLPTQAHLAFQLAHAQARDAVHLPLDTAGVAQVIAQAGMQTLQLHSAAKDRDTFLQRPDLGQRLDGASCQTLQAHAASRSPQAVPVLAFVVADGLSAWAVHNHAAPLLAAVAQRLRADNAHPWSIAPVAIVQQGRVAVGDEVGELLRASVVVVLIGERPGLSSPDSLGVYLSWGPRVGLKDAERNCISNIRQAGLSIDAAASKLHYLLTRARQLQMTGVGLKDDSDDQAALPNTEAPATLAGAGLWQLAPPGG